MSLILDHVGIAVACLDDALALWRDQLGANVTEIEVVESQGARVAFLETDTGSTTELLESTREDSAIGKFLASGRKGVHHLAYRVDDIEERLARLSEAGVPLIHANPVAGSRGTRIAFVHPRGTEGVLIELVQYPDR